MSRKKTKIETSEIIPIGCFIPVSFSEIHNENDR